MDINATLIGQTAAFLIFVVFCYKFVWPPITNAVNKRQAEIADSLSSAKQAREDIAKEKNVAEIELEKAKVKAKQIVDSAERQANEIVEKARAEAQTESKRIIDNAHNEISLERVKVQQELRAEVSSLAVTIAEKILEREISAKDNEDLIDKALSKL